MFFTIISGYDSSINHQNNSPDHSPFANLTNHLLLQLLLKKQDQITSTIRKLDASISLRGLVILCLYSIAHGSLYECVSTILEATTPSLNAKYMFLCGLILLRITGGLEWYIDFMDDEDGNMNEKVGNMHRQRKVLLRYLSKGVLFSTLTTARMSSWQNMVRNQRLRMVQQRSRAVKWFKRFPMVTLLVDLFAFYLIFISCTNVVSSLVTPMISTHKYDLLSDLPSSQLNITNGYHPSLINRYLSAALQQQSDDNLENYYQINNRFVEIVQDEIMKKKKNNDIVNHMKWCSAESVDHESNSNTCLQENHNASTFNSDDDVHLYHDNYRTSFDDTSFHIMAMRDLEEKWSYIDDEYIREVTSPWAYDGFFGNAESGFTKCPQYFALHASILVVTLYLLQKVGVSAGNILG